jgi:hypothetical protein
VVTKHAHTHAKQLNRLCARCGGDMPDKKKHNNYQTILIRQPGACNAYQHAIVHKPLSDSESRVERTSHSPLCVYERAFKAVAGCWPVRCPLHSHPMCSPVHNYTSSLQRACKKNTTCVPVFSVDHCCPETCRPSQLLHRTRSVMNVCEFKFMTAVHTSTLTINAF